MPPRLRTQRGMALILVLWISVLLTIMAATYTYERRTDAVLAIDQFDSIQSGALAEAAIARAVLALSQTEAEYQPISDGRVYSWAFAGKTLRFAVLSENGKIDINRASEELIYGLFSSLVGEIEELEQDDADALAEAVLDWRDPDDEARPAGAEDDDYLQAGFEYEAADRPFMTIAELLRVKGMTEPIFRRLEDAVTIYTGSVGVDPLSAPKRALLAIPDVDPGIVEQVIEMRTARTEANEQTEEIRDLFGDSKRFLSRGRASTYSIYADAPTDSGYRVGRRAVIRLGRNKKDPYVTVAWFDHADLTQLGTLVEESEAGEVATENDGPENDDQRELSQ